jgi:hypothetical protein
MLLFINGSLLAACALPQQEQDTSGHNPRHRKMEWIRHAMGVEMTRRLNGSIHSNALAGIEPGRSRTGHAEVFQKSGYQVTFKWKKIESAAFIDSELGMIYLWDSLFFIHRDKHVFKGELALQIEKWLCVSGRSDLSTALLKGFTFFMDDSGRRVRCPVHSFLTPLENLNSIGIRFSWPDKGYLYLGIPALKMGYLLNREVAGSPVFEFAVHHPDLKRFVMEYGYSAGLEVQCQVGPHCDWECCMSVFMRNRKPPDIKVQNRISYKGTKYFSASLLTRLALNSHLLRDLKVENVLTVGLYLERSW